VDVFAHGGRLVLAGRARERVDVVEYANGRLRVRDRKNRALGIGAREARELFCAGLDRLLERNEAVGRKALDEPLVENAELDAGVLDERVLRVELTERVDLLVAQQRGGLRLRRRRPD
jgi:hypothetical protein